MDKIFQGKSENFSLEEAMKDAISKDPKGDPGTDIFNYEVIETKCSFGGFVETYRLYVKIKRIKNI